MSPSEQSDHSLPYISIVLPTRNEERFIRACLDSIAAFDYPLHLREVIIVDGMSTDATRSIIAEYTRIHHEMRMIDNPKKILAAGWNEGIKQAVGSIIFTLNGHGIFARDYISECIDAFKQYPDASNVGGIVRAIPIQETRIGTAISTVLSHPFGVGNSYLRIGTDKPRWADTAAFGGYKREVFDAVGLFNEHLTRSQDMEFHVRMKRAHKKILITPNMHCDYYTRSSFMEYIRFNFWNGFWTTYPLSISPMAFSLRHFVPLIFVLSLIVTALIGFLSGSYLPFFGLIALYALAALMAVVHAAWKNPSPSVIFLPILFPLLHVSYGLGSLAGCIRAANRMIFWKNIIHSARS